MKNIQRAILSTSSMLSMTLVAAAATISATPAFAADEAATAAAASTGDIVVTARKRSEDVLKTPVTVSVLTGADISARGIVSINDITKNTPGINLNNNSSGRNDRSFQQIVLRGFTPSTANLTTTSIFIDGVPVASPSAIETIDDPARVEILKGPQTAYFGRNTFAGAVNIVTKAPSETFGGSISGLIGTRNNYDVHADLTGPIIGDKLLFRASVRKFFKGGSYKNGANPNEHLGDQGTTSGSLALEAHPSENLTFKALGMLIKDKDGPSAQGRIAPDQANCTLISRATLIGTTFSGATVLNPWYCGTAPKLANGSPAQNTLVDSKIRDILASGAGQRVVDPSDGVQGYGLVRTAYHLHFIANYEVPGTEITLSSLTGYNNEFYSELADLDNYDTRGLANTPANIAVIPDVTVGGRSYYDFPFIIERRNKDFSQEFRLTSGQKQHFRWTVGGSYLLNKVQNSGSGFQPQLGLIGATPFSKIGGLNKSKTLGAFFGLAYDVTEQFTLNVDGRYQIDHIYTYSGGAGSTIQTTSGAVFIPYNGLIIDKKFKKFLPRVIANFQVDPELMVYASFSKGVNPALFNNSFLSLPASTQPLAQAAGLSVIVKPEQIDNYEVGFKGKAMDGRIRFSVAAYYAKWKDQINATSIAPIINGNPQLVQGSLNTGDVTVRGVEFELTAAPTDQINLNFAGSVNDPKINSYQCRTCSLLTGITDFSGKQMPNTSKYSANAGAQYTAEIPGLDNTEWYVRADYSFKSGVYSSASNLTKTPDIHLVNVRAGLKRDDWSFEGFILNAFNNKAYTTIAENNFFHPTQSNFNYPSTLIVGLPDLRTFGVKASYKF